MKTEVISFRLPVLLAERLHYYANFHCYENFSELCALALIHYTDAFVHGYLQFHGGRYKHFEGETVVCGCRVPPVVKKALELCAFEMVNSVSVACALLLSNWLAKVEAQDKYERKRRGDRYIPWARGQAELHRRVAESCLREVIKTAGEG